MAVDQYALCSLANAMAYMGLDGDDLAESGLAVYHDGTGSVTTATVTVTDTTLVLVATGAATITTTYTFANAADDTLTEIVASINALAGTESAGWTARLLGPAATSSTLLIPVASTSALLQANEQVLNYQDTATLESLIDAASDAIETYCGRQFLTRDYREWIDADCHDVVLRNSPVTAVKRIASGSATALTVRGTTTTDLRATVEVQDTGLVLSRFASNGTETVSSTTLTFVLCPTASDLVTAINLLTGWTATIGTNCISLDLARQGGRDAKGVSVEVTFPDSSDYEYHVNEDAGILTITRGPEWGWSDAPSGTWGSGKVLVHYTGGYVAVPDDLEQICIELVQDAYNARGKDTGVQSESIGSYSYVSRILNAPEGTAFRDRLSHWRTIR